MRRKEANAWPKRLYKGDDVDLTIFFLDSWDRGRLRSWSRECRRSGRSVLWSGSRGKVIDSSIFDVLLFGHCKLQTEELQRAGSAEVQQSMEVEDE